MSSSIKSSHSQSKDTSGLFLNQLYKLLFRNQKAELVIYIITLAVALTFAIISNFILKRPQQTVLYEGSILALLTFVSLVFGYVYGASRARKKLSISDMSKSTSLVTLAEAAGNASKDQIEHLTKAVEGITRQMQDFTEKFALVLKPGEVRAAQEVHVASLVSKEAVVEAVAIAIDLQHQREKLLAGLKKAAAIDLRQAEELLTSMMAIVLEVEKVGINDDFFELGGNSLLAAKLLAYIKDIYQVELPVRAIFEHPTVAGLVKAINSSFMQDITQDDLEQVARRLGLSAEQVRREWDILSRKE